MSINSLQYIANILRRDSLIATTEAQSGHPTSCLSSAEIMASLFFSHMKYDTSNPNKEDNDEFILSKGHAAPILYSALFRAGCIPNDPKTLRKINSPLEGHPMPVSLNWVKAATGSLGQGLSIGVGMAIANKLQNRKAKVFVLLGDSELAEGSIYEALQLAPFYSLNNLIAIVDVNKLGQTRETMLGHHLKSYKKRFESFGWNVFQVNGHNIKQISKALTKTNHSDKPSIILAQTIKGKGVSFLEGKLGWHGKALSQEELDLALDEIPETTFPEAHIQKPEKTIWHTRRIRPDFREYYFNEQIATRSAYGIALASLALSNSKVLALDAEVSNSTHSEDVKILKSNQFIETFIQEQNLISISLGLSKKGFIPFASTFSAFLTRAHDQIRMAALSNGNFTICGSHSGVSIGKDGASQMGLEDISMFRALPNSVILYPSDAVSTQSLVKLCSEIPNLKYIRTTRDKTPILYDNKEKFTLGNFKILKESKSDKVVLIGAGITLHESLKAHSLLKDKKIDSAVIDLYCIKPLNTKKLIDFVKKHGNKIIVTEDHRKEGGIGEMLSSELKNTNIEISHLAVEGIPHSGTSQELLAKHKINADSIYKEALSILKS